MEQPTSLSLIRNHSAKENMFNRWTKRWLSTAFMLFLSGTAYAQTESQIESDEVKRVGVHLTCQCGCKDDVNCMMSGGQCPVCKPMRTKIFRMQQSGMDDSAILAAFVKELGQKVFRPDPDSSFWLVPYFTLGASGLLLTFLLKRMRERGQRQNPTPVPSGGPDADFAHYREAIEKRTGRLD
jgi:cytochrome c-type biogenesis protein CcmH/NrfF